MKIRLICLTGVMLAAAPLYAQAAGCATYEYAELKEMTTAELKKVSGDITIAKFLSSDARRPNRDGDDLCDREKAKVDRMIAKREAEAAAPAATESTPDQPTADVQPAKTP